MTNLSNLARTTTRQKKRVGRGYGSGKGGHTSGRGAKGQLARNSVAKWFEGGQLPLIKRLPFQRGKGRFKSLVGKPIIVNLKYLNVLPPGSKVTLECLIEHKLVRPSDGKKYGVKILGEGKIAKALIVLVPISKQAAAAIKKAGGSIGETKKATSTVTKTK